jgi:hypothetical protein
MSFPSQGSMIGKGRPGGTGGNKVSGDTGGDAVRKSRPGGPGGQSSEYKGAGNDPIRKSRPKSSGSGQSTNTK